VLAAFAFAPLSPLASRQPLRPRECLLASHTPIAAPSRARKRSAHCARARTRGAAALGVVFYAPARAALAWRVCGSAIAATQGSERFGGGGWRRHRLARRAWAASR